MQFEDRTILNKIKDIIVFVAIAPLVLMSYILPSIVYRVLFSTIVVLLCVFIPETYLMNNNLKLAMPDKSFLQRLKIIVGVWFNLGLFFAEYFYVYRYSERKLRKIVDVKDDALNMLNIGCKGKIIISGHYANWELGLSFLSKTLKKKMNIVYRQSNNILLEQLVIRKHRTNDCHINLIAKQDNAGIKIVKALKQNEIVVILADQSDRQHGVLVDFFRTPAYTNTTVYKLYRKFDVDLFFLCCLRKKKIYKFTLYAEKLIFDKNISEQEFLLKINELIEKYILKSPWQWFWVHNRWRIE